MLSIFLPIRVQQEQVMGKNESSVPGVSNLDSSTKCGLVDKMNLLTQELVETILYSMDRQKDGYIRLQDLITGLRSSTSFSLSMYREEFILAGLMVAGFLLYQVFPFTNRCILLFQPPR